MRWLQRTLVHGQEEQGRGEHEREGQQPCHGHRVWVQAQEEQPVPERQGLGEVEWQRACWSGRVDVEKKSED
jgi:hypothetical protein